MALGFGLLRLEPRAFWSMTPREVAAAARAILPPSARRDARPTRADLLSLIARYPDTASSSSHIEASHDATLL